MGAGRQGAFVAVRLKANPDTNPEFFSILGSDAFFNAHERDARAYIEKADSSPLKTDSE